MNWLPGMPSVSSDGSIGRRLSIAGFWVSVEMNWLNMMSTRLYVPAR
jgi:hypothetical protein